MMERYGRWAGLACVVLAAFAGNVVAQPGLYLPAAVPGPGYYPAPVAAPSYMSPAPGTGYAVSAAPAAAPALIQAQFNQSRQDLFGTQWMLDGGGYVRCDAGGYSSVSAMTIQGSGFSLNMAQMTPDASEYFLTGNCNGLNVTRRIKIDAKSGTLRYFETFHNPQNTPINTSVVLGTRFNQSIGVMAPSSGVSAGKPATPPPISPAIRSRTPAGAPAVVLGEKDCGFVVSNGGMPQPLCLVYYVAATRSKLKPAVQRPNSNQVNVVFPINVPPQQTVAILHGFAQRPPPAQLDAANLAKLFKPFLSSQWGRDLPRETRKMILNGGGNTLADEPAVGPVLEAVGTLADRYDVQRSKGDVLVADEQTQMTGAISGGDLTVATRFGTAKVPLDEAALVIGGAGMDRATAVHLRNGEILVGPVEFKDAVLKIDSGLEVQLSAKQVNYLFLHADAQDGKLPAEAVALATTHQGDRLAVAAKPATKFSGVTPWGPVEVGLAEVESLVLLRNPQPIYRLAMTDGSRWSLMLGGDAWKLPTLRFGSLSIAPSAIARLTAAKALAAFSADRDEPDGELKVPHCRLAGNNVVAGTIDAGKLKIETSSGVTTVDTANILSIEAVEGAAARGLLTLQMLDESQVSGRLADGVLPIRTHGKVWKFPAHHVAAYQSMKEKPPAKDDEASEEKPEPGKPENKAAAKDNVQRVEAKPPAVVVPVPPPPPASTPATIDPYSPRPTPTPLPPQPPDDSDDPFGMQMRTAERYT